MIKEILKKLIPARLRSMTRKALFLDLEERVYYKHYKRPNKFTTAYSHIQIANIILLNF